MIVEYHRPETLDEALKLLQRKKPMTRPLGGGTVLSAPSKDEFAVVDLQALGLDTLSKKGKQLSVGATLNLQTLIEKLENQSDLKKAIKLEHSLTMRRMASVAGALVSADGRSSFAIAALALDAGFSVAPGDEAIPYGEFLPLRKKQLNGKIITAVNIPNNANLSYQYAARTKKDLPMIALALAQWPGGRTRLAVGGFGSAPILALDGKDPSGLEEALANALHGASDEWASEEYRLDAGLALLQRAAQATMEAAS